MTHTATANELTTAKGPQSFVAVNGSTVLTFARWAWAKRAVEVINAAKYWKDAVAEIKVAVITREGGEVEVPGQDGADAFTMTTQNYHYYLESLEDDESNAERLREVVAHTMIPYFTTMAWA